MCTTWNASILMKIFAMKNCVHYVGSLIQSVYTIFEKTKIGWTENNENTEKVQYNYNVLENSQIDKGVCLLA